MSGVSGRHESQLWAFGQWGPSPALRAEARKRPQAQGIRVHGYLLQTCQFAKGAPVQLTTTRLQMLPSLSGRELLLLPVTSPSQAGREETGESGRVWACVALPSSLCPLGSSPQGVRAGLCPALLGTGSLSGVSIRSQRCQPDPRHQLHVVTKVIFSSPCLSPCLFPGSKQVLPTGPLSTPAGPRRFHGMNSF